MNQITTLAVTTLDELCNHYDAFLLDAYGVFWASNQEGAYLNAKEAMEKLVLKGKYVVILSNSSQLAENEKKKLERHQIYQGIHYHFLYTSGQVAHQTLKNLSLPFKTPHYTYWQWGDNHPRYAKAELLFENTLYKKVEQIEKADFIYIHIPHIDGLDQEKSSVFETSVKEACSYHLPVLCTNPDLFAHEGNPKKLVVRQGSIAKLFEKYGAIVHYIGKPYEQVYQIALQAFPSHITTDKILMIGDTLETDICGAKKVGLKAALVTETGIFNEKKKDTNEMTLLESLPKHQQPDYFIRRFEFNDL